MRVHHLTCTQLRPLSSTLLFGHGGYFSRGQMVCHVLLVEHRKGLILIDTGYGRRELNGTKKLPWTIRFGVGPVLHEDDAAYHQVQRLGYSVHDVKHIVPTHLDHDHAGGLVDFPHAHIHISDTEYHQACEVSTVRNVLRYDRAQYAHHPRWCQHTKGQDTWMGFNGVRPLFNDDDSVLLVPLPGHTFGHTGVAVKNGDRWVFHVGDAYFDRRQMQSSASAPTMLRLIHRFLAQSPSLGDQTLANLQNCAEKYGHLVDIVSAHDVKDWN